MPTSAGSRLRRVPPAALLGVLALGAAGCSGASPAAQAAPAPVRAPLVSDAPTVGTPEPGADHAAFTMPSGNITCLLEKGAGAADAVRCQIAERSWTPPPQPAECTSGWGDGVTVTEGRAEVTCAGDSVAGWVEPGTDGPVTLAYGSVITLGDVTCESREDGVRCSDTTTGAGFVLSRARYELFGG
ncbi:DUF6636 domain-containing protein [Quadrisphaera sp. DSM 44207]|uniref:DUF6636 domain-containing protein n=1 Tax=Quadrisphaera sp. DSM 44207 TaxID=1881057 RepID=UPI00087E8641|nr:DUF6636 domain-containing protein [Quadrisphaera sp. DSM 44207]SDQ11834.1 hypothetical protein SAMN05428996_0627 [Quadrisphaera sp. DSM 44207]